jgi:arsenical pump membrane protein
MPHVLTWIVAALTVLLILIRPKHIPEAVWACSGALLLILLRLISPGNALAAAGRGMDVYLFLTGMMVLAELARREGFFDWVAAIAVEHAKGSRKRLFGTVYAVGIAVTVFLSNDGTAVVLTPAVLAALKKAPAEPLPYLFICAFIANAASFVLPISNPANLVLYGSNMPSLISWLKLFGLPSMVSIAVTFAILRLWFAEDLRGIIQSELVKLHLSPAGRRAAYGIAGAGIALMLASAFNMDLGLPTFLVAIAALVLVAPKDHGALFGIVRQVSWSILPLVAGLFVLVAAIDQAGALAASQDAMEKAAKSGPVVGALSSAFGVAFLSNIANNLPVGLIAGSAVRAGAVSPLIRNALLIGVDLGPNLSVTGSLATILWLVALRRDGEDVSFWKFLRVGLLVMPPALALSVLASVLSEKL